MASVVSEDFAGRRSKTHRVIAFDHQQNSFDREPVCKLGCVDNQQLSPNVHRSDAIEERTAVDGTGRTVIPIERRLVQDPVSR